MRRTLSIAIVAAAAFVVLASGGQPLARAEIEGSVAIGCEFITDAIDGDLNDVTVAADTTDACVDGVDADDVDNLANTLGDQDSTLESTDFTSIDRDANQMRIMSPGITDEILVFQFVDNDAVVMFDAEVGVSMVVHDDDGGFSADNDVNPETCAQGDDRDCDNNVLIDGDGVVVATAKANVSADAGETNDLDLFQTDDTGNVQVQTINIVGAPATLDLQLQTSTIHASGNASSVQTCMHASSALDTTQWDDVNRTSARAVVRDAGTRVLTRIPVQFSTTDADVAAIDTDSGEPASAPKGTTGVSVDAGASGIAAFAIVCGGFEAATRIVNASDLVNGANDMANITVTIVDNDGDGMADSYEATRGCLILGFNDSALNPDNDGLSNGAEYNTTGTEPCFTDTDGDTCADGEEVEPGRTHQFGGQRDPLNPYDFYDVNLSGRIDAADIGLVRSAFTGGAPTAPEDAYLDRSAGAANWAPNGPDGFINAVDIGHVRASFNDRCDTPP